MVNPWRDFLGQDALLGLPSIEHPVSSIHYPVSRIENPVSSIQNPVSSICARWNEISLQSSTTDGRDDGV